MKVLITGANGFIGRHLREWAMGNPDFDVVMGATRTDLPHREFYSQGYAIYGHTLVDLAVQSEVEHLFSHFKPDIIYHLAANPIPKLDEQNPTKIIRDNVIATQNLLHFCPAGCRFIFASSITVYGNWLTELDSGFNENTKCWPNSVYGLTKLTSEQLLNIYHTKRNLKTCSLRLCAVGGVESQHGIIPDLVTNMRIGSESYLPIIGNKPGSAKPYMHIDDCIEAFKLATKIASLGALYPNLFNVGPNDSINCEEIGNLVLKYFGFPNKNRIHWRGEEANWHGDNRLLKFDSGLFQKYGWKPKYPTSAAAVEQTVKEKYEQFAKEHTNGPLSCSR